MNENEENKDEHKEPSHHSDKEETMRFIINPHAEKMEKTKSQLQALLHGKELQEVGIVHAIP